MDLHIRYPAISDLREAARRRIPHFVFEYLDAGTGDELAMRRNRERLDAVQMLPAILKGKLDYDLSCSFLGHRFPYPFGIAPVGMSGLMWPRAEKILAASARRAGIPYAMSTVATVTPEDLGRHIGEHAWFQLYLPADPEVRRDMLARARAAGFSGLILTVDVPAESRRERQRRADLSIPPKTTPRMLWQAAVRPRWSLGTLREGVPRLKLAEEYAEASATDGASTHHAAHVIRGYPDWSHVEVLREEWEGPFMVKGVQRAEDAARLAGMGVDAIWVSNHSARQFDAGPASIDVLPLIRAAAPETPIVFDSGISSGLDILRALALGADFVMLGRAWHYAVAALGEAGPPHLVEILADDMQANMGQIGAARLADVPSALLPRG